MTTTTKPTVRLTGRDGNAFAIIGACRTAAKKAGWTKEQLEALTKDMISGDYNHLLTVALDRFDVR